MKKDIVIGVLLSLMAIKIYADDGGYQIRIKINGTKDTVMMLANHFGDKQYVQDTAKIDSKGFAEFKGKEKLPGGIYLAVMQSKRYFEFLVTENQNFTLEADSSDFTSSMKIKGSKENEDFYKYLSFIEKKGKEMESLRKYLENKDARRDSAEYARKRAGELDIEVKSFKKDFIKANSTTFLADIFKASLEPEMPEIPVLPNGRKDSIFQFNYYKKHYLDNVNFANDKLLRTPLLHSKIKYYLDNLTYQIPDSISKSCIEVCEKAKANKEVFKYCVVTLTSQYEKSNIMGMEAVFVDLVDKYYKTNQAYWTDSVTLFKIKDRADKLKPLLIGKTAPNLILKDTANTYQSLYNLKNKYIILAFWDPDCGHCKKEMPKLYSEFDTKLRKKDVQAFAVCTETERKKWTEFIRKENLNWINVADIELVNPFRSIYDITSTPVVYLLDSNKKILAKRIPVDKIEEFIDRHSKTEISKK